jgi:hypothetical protein
VAERTSWLALVSSVFQPLASWSIGLSFMGARRSVAVGLGHGLGEGVECFVRQVVPSARPSLLAQ